MKFKIPDPFPTFLVLMILYVVLLGSGLFVAVKFLTPYVVKLEQKFDRWVEE